MTALDDRYRQRLDDLRGTVTQRLVTLYGTTIEPQALDDSFAVLSPKAAPIIRAGQSVALSLATAYLSALVLRDTGRSARLPIRTDLVGTSGAGTLLEGMAAWPAMVKAQIAQGAPTDQAVGYGRYLVERFGDAEITRVVDAQTDHATKESGLFVGWLGVIAGTCEICLTTNSGPHPIGEDVYRHPGCRCSQQFSTQLALPGFGGKNVPLIGAKQFASEAEALAWAEQNMPDVMKLSSAARNKLQGYSGQGFGPTNRTLRGQSRDYLRGNPAEPDLVGKELTEAVAEEAAISKRLTAALDEVMAPLPDNITVYRALKENVLVDSFKLPSEDLAGLRKLVGQTFEDKGFMSTSLGGVADTYQGLPVQMHITVAQGTKATYLRPLSYYQNENELLLARGTRFTITSVREESGHWVVEAVVLPT